MTCHIYIVVAVKKLLATLSVRDNPSSQPKRRHFFPPYRQRTTSTDWCYWTPKKPVVELVKAFNSNLMLES